MSSPIAEARIAIEAAIAVADLVSQTGRQNSPEDELPVLPFRVVAMAIS